MLALRVVLARRAAQFATLNYHNNRTFSCIQHGKFNNRLITQHTRMAPQFPLLSRQYSTNQKNKEGENNEENKEEKIKDEEAEKQEGLEGEGKEGEGKEKEGEVKEEDLVEPAWRTARAGEFQKKQPTHQEAKIPESIAYLYWILGFTGLGIGIYEIYKSVSFAQKENTADPNLLYRKVLDESIKAIQANQKIVDKLARTACVVEESMVQCQSFSTVTSISYPLLQTNTAARVGTVYIDVVREEDTFNLKSAYVDFVYGKQLDLIEAGIIKPEKFSFYLFSREFSVEESMKQMYEMAAQQEQMHLQQQQQRQQQQQQQRR